jgi:hypothetical protein
VRYYTPVKRSLFISVSYFSLLLCLATAGLWVRSHFATDMVQWASEGKAQLIGTPTGTLAYLSTTDKLAGKPRLGFIYSSSDIKRDFLTLKLARSVSFLGFGFAWNSPWADGGSLTLVHAPFWFVLILTSILPILRVRRELIDRRRRQWLASNRCGHCGYDLRGSPDRCPECGNTPQNMVSRSN